VNQLKVGDSETILSMKCVENFRRLRLCRVVLPVKFEILLSQAFKMFENLCRALKNFLRIFVTSHLIQTPFENLQDISFDSNTFENLHDISFDF
jgi:hypothetical protein